MFQAALYNMQNNSFFVLTCIEYFTNIVMVQTKRVNTGTYGLCCCTKQSFRFITSFYLNDQPKHKINTVVSERQPVVGKSLPSQVTNYFLWRNLLLSLTK